MKISFYTLLVTFLFIPIVTTSPVQANDPCKSTNDWVDAEFDAQNAPDEILSP